MLNRAGDEMSRRLAGEAEESEVVCLRRAAREDHLIGVGAEQRRHLFACVFKRPARTASGPVGAGRVAEGIDEVRPHGFPDGRQERGGRVVVEIDLGHDRATRKMGRGRNAMTLRQWALPASTSLYARRPAY